MAWTRRTEQGFVEVKSYFGCEVQVGFEEGTYGSSHAEEAVDCVVWTSDAKHHIGFDAAVEFGGVVVDFGAVGQREERVGSDTDGQQ